MVLLEIRITHRSIGDILPHTPIRLGRSTRFGRFASPLLKTAAGSDDVARQLLIYMQQTVCTSKIHSPRSVAIGSIRAALRAGK